MLSDKSKKIFAATFILIMLFAILAVNKSGNVVVVENVLSANNITLNEENFSFKELDTFDSYYSSKNKDYASKLSINEDEAFILGCFGKYWAKNLLYLRKVKLSDGDIIYYRFGYKTRFENSPYCLKNGKPTNDKAFEKQLKTIRKGKFVLVDLDTDTIYPISKTDANRLKNYIVVRKSHVKTQEKKNENPSVQKNQVLNLGNIKIILSDSTSKLIPDRNCSSDICKEILNNINQTKNTLDIAIYGYSSTPAIEKAIKSAQNRGVKIRMVYDIDKKGGNIYPDTEIFTKLITNNISDSSSPEVNNTMHNKFYIFDKRTVITGSANLSHTDMSGYNSNMIVVLKSPEIAKIYTQEFEQMYAGKFHNDKTSTPNKSAQKVKIFFAPQDKPIENGVLPIIRNAKKYIYIPAFVITERQITDELIKAKSRGVEVKIIVDALNASTKHSKHVVLRNSGIPVKAENYAGKMHSKTIIVDDEYLITGSMNFSNSGNNKNDENMVILNSPDAAKFCREFFLYQWNKIPDRWLKYTPRAEGKDSIGSCTDKIDNNYDGMTDADDKGCQ
ncbi:DUF1669 domain-containing protein [bacterium]|nr:DUF1669 domain-containing protein [bacterium]